MVRSPSSRHVPLAPAALLALSLALPGPPVAAAPAQAPAAKGPVSIAHEAPGCVAAGKYPKVGACFDPAAALARARIYFRAGGTADWFYVEMAGPPPCLEGTLPRPKKGLQRIEYYLAATDRGFAESRTPERAVQVSSDGQCRTGKMAPFAEAASVVIGSLTGAAPVGFVTGSALSPLLIAGGVAVVGGGAAAVVAGGGGEEPPPTTTLPPTTTTTTTSSTTTTSTTTTTLPPEPPPTTTTTTSTTTTSTTSTTTTTTRPPCETVPPTVQITSPPTGNLGGLAVTVEASASDPGSGVKEVRFSYQNCPGTPAVCGALNAIGSDSSSPYSASWVFPSCSAAPADRFRIVARAEDNCGNVADSGVDVRLTGRGDCFRGAGPEAAAATASSWTSVLSVPGGRGQVVVDGASAVFPGAGAASFFLPAGPGAHRFEATLVDGTGRPGTWRFELSALGATPGSLRVVAGQAALAGSDAVVFQLRGQPGERLVFTVQVGGE